MDNKEGKWAVTNTRSSMDPFLTYADNRGLREKVWRNYYNRGDNGDEHDNNKIIAEILKLRAARAKLLGYETHAHWRMEPTMAKKPEAAMDLMMKVWPKALARVKEEVADMQAIADSEEAGITIEPWDYRYYAEKVRKAKYDLDFNEVKPYLQLDKLREAMMWAAGQLYGLQFKQLSGIPGLSSRRDRLGSHRCRRQTRRTVVSRPVRPRRQTQRCVDDRLSRQENMGNADHHDRLEQLQLHQRCRRRTGVDFLGRRGDAVPRIRSRTARACCPRSTIRSQSGTSVARDYVEFPSQLNEHWLETPEILNRFAVHYKTGEPMPQELLDKIKKARTFNQGFDTVEYLASALIDMKLHLAGEADIDPDTFERETLGGDGHAEGAADASSHAPVHAHLQQRQLFGRLLQLSVVRRPDRRCGRAF